MRASVALFLVSLVALPLAAQQNESAADSGARIQVEVNVVNIPVTVTDADGKFIVDLQKTDFEVFENGQPVEIRYFSRASAQEAELPPLHIGFLIDLSNSARLYYKTYKDSIGDLAFLLMPEGGRNQGFLMGYHTEVDLLVDMTNDPYLLAEKMEKLKHGGGSSMLGAVYQACSEKLASKPYLGSSDPRKVLVVVGDGHDNASTQSLSQVIEACQRNQVTVYAVSTEAWGFHEKEAENLYKMARETGGRVTQPMQNVHKDVSGYLSKPQDAGNFAYTVGTGEFARAQLQALYGAITKISGDVQSQYILGYVPPTPLSEGTFREVTVKVKLNADVQINHRPGYFPPPIG